MIFTGPLTGPSLGAAYGVADLLVLPSRSESYGMVVVEALAHGLPVVATAVGGVPEALGRAPIGALPGMLVPPEEPEALAGALRAWLDDPGLRERLTHAAAGRRPTLRRWSETVDDLDAVLDRVAARPTAQVGGAPDERPLAECSPGLRCAGPRAGRWSGGSAPDRSPTRSA